jgi:microsomal dipeptidase-like Zn-dependent dipeptidase
MSLAAAGLAVPGVRVAARQPRGPAPVIDALGEIRLDYEPELLDAILASGMRGCVITVGNPALHGASAFTDMKAEIEAYDRHIAAHRARLARATAVADIERAAGRGALALIYYTQNATPLEDDLARL